MTAKNGNEPAFPCGADCVSREGMSLRDYFAAAALPALITTAYQHNSNTDLGGSGYWPVTVDEIAEKAYRYADWMLKARRS